MKALAALVMAVVFVLVVSTSVLFPSVPSDLQASARAGSGFCARYGVQFDDSSIEDLYLHPEGVLADPGRFWASDGAYQVVSAYYESRGLAAPPGGWQARLEQVAALPVVERQQELPYRVARALMAHREAFCEMAVPHVLSFLPPGTGLDTTIYLTALTDAYVPYKHPDMAVDTSASSHIVYTGLLSLPPQLLRSPASLRSDPLAQGSATTIYNTLVHELFHAGFWRSTPQPAGVPDPLQEALTALQNEGIAVYVAHLAEAVFPAPLETDYREQRSTIKRQMDRLNGLFAEADVLPDDEFRARLSGVGFGQKALYNAGGYMAMTIDRQLGRSALVETIGKGPEWFVRTYNAVAEPGLQIRYNEAPTVLVPKTRPSTAVSAEPAQEVGIKDSPGAHALQLILFR